MSNDNRPPIAERLLAHTLATSGYTHDIMSEAHAEIWRLEDALHDALSTPIPPAPASPWIAVSERMPEDGEEALCAMKNPRHFGPYLVLRFSKEREGWYDRNTLWLSPGNVTHWQPIIPPLPAANVEVAP